jgi:hypothetical protein
LELISHEGVGIFNCIEEHLDGLQYKHILKHTIVPSVRVLYPNGVIQFQQDHHSTHDSCAVQKWLLQQGKVGLIEWPPCVLDMNPTENIWNEVKNPFRKHDLTP